MYALKPLLVKANHCGFRLPSESLQDKPGDWHQSHQLPFVIGALVENPEFGFHTLLTCGDVAPVTVAIAILDAGASTNIGVEFFG